MRRTTVIEPADNTPFDNEIVPLLAIRLAHPMNDANATCLAEITSHRSALLGWPREDGQLGLEAVGKRKDTLAREHGAGAKGGAGLPLALGAVAMVDAKGHRGGGLEAHKAALAHDIHFASSDRRSLLLVTWESGRTMMNA